jgi:hypothetical protein
MKRPFAGFRAALVISAAAMVFIAANASGNANSEEDFQVALTGDGSGVVIVKYLGKASAVVIPAVIQGMPVKELADESFESGPRITSVVIPEGVLKIGRSAFAYQNALASVTLPDTLQYIGSFAFAYCSKLAAITLPPDIRVIDQWAFRQTGLTHITLPDSLAPFFADPGNVAREWDGQGVAWETYETFEKCTALASITFGESITVIQKGMFSGCTGLKTVTLPRGIQRIDPWAFYGCTGLSTVTIPENVSAIAFQYFENGAFSGCGKLTLATQAALKKVGYNDGF